MTQLGKVYFIKVNELKLTQIELFSSLFHFKFLVNDAYELFSMAHLANNKHFLYHSNFSFLISSFIYMLTHQLHQRKSTQVREDAFYSFPRENAPSCS